MCRVFRHMHSDSSSSRLLAQVEWLQLAALCDSASFPANAYACEQALHVSQKSARAKKTTDETNDAACTRMHGLMWDATHQLLHRYPFQQDMPLHPRCSPSLRGGVLICVVRSSHGPPAYITTPLRKWLEWHPRSGRTSWCSYRRRAGSGSPRREYHGQRQQNALQLTLARGDRAPHCGINAGKMLNQY